MRAANHFDWRLDKLKPHLKQFHRISSSKFLHKFILLVLIIGLLSTVIVLPVSAASGWLVPDEGYIGTEFVVQCNGLPLGITALVWFDSNNDGICDESEPKVSVVTISFLSSGVLPSRTTLMVPDIVPGVYYVHINAPIGNPIEASPQFTVMDQTAGLPSLSSGSGPSFSGITA